jgi:histidinol-phosphate aminotransferase
MLDAVKKQPADLIYICNPNNPTGSITPRTEIEKFLQQLPAETLVLIDEAYHHFVSPEVDYRSFADHRIDDHRVIVARTFSKVYGMAGLRVGYSVSQPETNRKLSRFIVFDNPNCIAARAAVAALKDERALQQATGRIIADRQEFIRQAQARKLKMIPSQANFVMIETGRPIRQVIDHFNQHTVRIGRPFPPYDLYARISLGTPAEMQEFWRIFDAMDRNPQA